MSRRFIVGSGITLAVGLSGYALCWAYSAHAARAEFKKPRPTFSRSFNDYPCGDAPAPEPVKTADEEQEPEMNF
jgi:hypothetical protein